jgi:hypothetical protein
MCGSVRYRTDTSHLQTVGQNRMNGSVRDANFLFQIHDGHSSIILNQLSNFFNHFFGSGIPGTFWLAYVAVHKRKIGEIRKIRGSAFWQLCSLPTWTASSVYLIWSFRLEVDESCALLGYYAVGSAYSLTTFRDNLSVSSPRVKNSWKWILTFEDWTERLSWNVCKDLPYSVRNSP